MIRFRPPGASSLGLLGIWPILSIFSLHVKLLFRSVSASVAPNYDLIPKQIFWLFIFHKLLRILVH